MKKEAVKKLQFKFKYFPENVADEVIQDSTMRMLFRQVHSLKEEKKLFDNFKFGHFMKDEKPEP